MITGQYKTIVFLLIALTGAVLAKTSQATESFEYKESYAGDLVWQGKVTMAADVLILKGGSLTIKPGTEVTVVPAEGTKIDPEYLSSQTELLVRGFLDIQGTPTAPVRFVLASVDDSTDTAWAGITLDRAGDSRIAHAKLERADIAIRCVQSSPDIVGNRISRSRYGIVAQHQSHPVIQDNLLVDGEGGIFCWRHSHPQLINNRVLGHDEEGVFIDATSYPRMVGNRISQNAIGLALYPSDEKINDAEIQNNTENVRWLGRQGQEFNP